MSEKEKQIYDWLYEYLRWTLEGLDVSLEDVTIQHIDLENGECVLSFPLVVIEEDQYAGFRGY